IAGAYDDPLLYLIVIGRVAVGPGRIGGPNVARVAFDLRHGISRGSSWQRRTIDVAGGGDDRGIGTADRGRAHFAGVRVWEHVCGRDHIDRCGAKAGAVHSSSPSSARELGR